MNNDKDIVIVALARTAFDRFGGITKNIPSADLARAAQGCN
jgi:acetyl-CoA acetyltransferase